MTSHLEKPTVKRRTIWMSDEEWALLGRYAKENDRNVSEIIRDFWRSASNNPDPAVYDLPDLQGPVRGGIRGTHGKREASTGGLDGSGTTRDAARPGVAVVRPASFGHSVAAPKPKR